MCHRNHTEILIGRKLLLVHVRSHMIGNFYFSIKTRLLYIYLAESDN